MTLQSRTWTLSGPLLSSAELAASSAAAQQRDYTRHMSDAATPSGVKDSESGYRPSTDPGQSAQYMPGSRFRSRQDRRFRPERFKDKRRPMSTGAGETARGKVGTQMRGRGKEGSGAVMVVGGGRAREGVCTATKPQMLLSSSSGGAVELVGLLVGDGGQERWEMDRWTGTSVSGDAG